MLDNRPRLKRVRKIGVGLSALKFGCLWIAQDQIDFLHWLEWKRIGDHEPWLKRCLADWPWTFWIGCVTLANINKNIVIFYFYSICLQIIAGQTTFYFARAVIKLAIVHWTFNDIINN